MVSCSICVKTENVKECKHCGQNFCPDHINSVRTGIPDFNSKKVEDIEFLERDYKLNGHPCFQYGTYLNEEKIKEKEKIDQWWEEYDRIRKARRRGVINSEIRKEKLSEIKKAEVIYESPKPAKIMHYPRHPPKKTKRNLAKYIMAFILLAGIVFLWFLWNRGYFGDYLAGNKLLGGIIDNQLESKAMSNLVLSKINDVRSGKSLGELSYNRDSYNLAVTISKKFYKTNNYVISSLELEQLSEQYNLINISILSTKLDGLGEKDFNFMASQWTSRDIFAEKTLNKDFTDGAIGCYKEVCVFVLNVKSQTASIQPIQINVNKNSVNQITNENTKTNTPFQPTIDITSLEIEVHNLINTERQNNGLTVLSFDSKLSDIARGHSQDMAQNNFFEHTNLRGQDPTARAKAVGYSCYKDYGSYYIDGIAENIFQNNLYDSITYIDFVPIHNWNTESEIAQSTVQGWMNSPGHRENILTSTYDKEGIGIAISSDDKVYITEDFC